MAVVAKLSCEVAMDIKTPDDVNLFCAGSEGVDTPEDKRPICDGSNSVVLMTTPLTYINETEGDKPVWLDREIARIRFENGAKKPVREIVVAWERVRSSASWELTTTQQIDPKKTISHATLFYPASFGCEKDVALTACAQANAYAWSEFANDVISGRVKSAVFIFEPDFKGPPSPFAHAPARSPSTAATSTACRTGAISLQKRRTNTPSKASKGSFHLPTLTYPTGVSKRPLKVAASKQNPFEFPVRCPPRQRSVAIFGPFVSPDSNALDQ